MDTVYVVKVGGGVIDEEPALQDFLAAFAGIQGAKLLVHGGGRRASELARQMDIPQQMYHGRRVTDAATLELITMVYAGSINKSIVAGLQALHCNAIGLSGADGNLLPAVRRPVKDGLDFGYVGDILPGADTSLLQMMLDTGRTPVLAPLTHDGKGQLLNINADSIAQELAKALSAKYTVKLVYTFEQNGVLLDTRDKDSVIPVMGKAYYKQLLEEGNIYEGMIPKLDNAFAAVDAGVETVIIGNAGRLSQMIKGQSGTIIHI